MSPGESGSGGFPSSRSAYGELTTSELVRQLVRLDQLPHRIRAHHEVPFDEIARWLVHRFGVGLRLQSAGDVDKLVFPLERVIGHPVTIGSQTGWGGQLRRKHADLPKVGTLPSCRTYFSVCCSLASRHGRASTRAKSATVGWARRWCSGQAGTAATEAMDQLRCESPAPVRGVKYSGLVRRGLWCHHSCQQRRGRRLRQASIRLQRCCSVWPS